MEKMNVKPEFLFNLKALQEGAFSPDGKQVVYCVSQVNAEKEEESAGLWLLDVESGESRQLTTGTTRDYSPVWSPDGKEIAFLSVREKAPQIFVIRVDGGEARQITKMEQAIGEGPKWSPDGKYVCFTASVKLETPPDFSKPYRLKRNIYRFDSMGYVFPAVQNVYIVEVDGGEPKQLTDDEWMNTGLGWSPDGQEILYTASFNPDSGSMNQELRVVNMEGKSKVLVPQSWGTISATVWTPEKQILFVGQVSNAPAGSKADLWLIKRGGGEPECRTGSLDITVGGGLQPDFAALPKTSLKFNEDGSKVYYTAHFGGNVHIYSFTLKGEEKAEALIEGDRAVFINDACGDKLLCVSGDFFKTPDLIMYDVKTKEEKQLTWLNKDELEKWNMPELENFKYTGAEGVEIEGWYVKPTTDVKAPYPTILYIHGGPNGAFGNTFHFDFQMFAGAGYGVVFANPQGSTGYGDEFATSIIGDWGNRDYKDLMAGVDYVIEKGWADAEKFGVAGISYGGYMTSWILGHTDRFKAAIPENPVTDLVLLYGTGDIPAYLIDSMGGKPHEVPEVYRKCSPNTYAHNCKTPTLLIQGESDFRCPANQSESFYTILKANGCEVEMLRVPNSSHTMSINGAPMVRKTQNLEMLKWMNKHILGIEEPEEEEKQDEKES